jgi:tetratricopeptide (TPR) repeat protein
MADCQVRASQPAPALESYRLAAKIAAQTGHQKLESLATVNEAKLEENAGDTTSALELYQRALVLDESIHDQSASAEDWFAYGRFLQSSHFPPRLVYACLVKSTMLQGSLPEASERQFVENASRQAATEAAVIRRNPEPFLQAALQLRP